MSFQFHETMYGKRFFEGQLPSLIKAINRLAGAIEDTKQPTSSTVYVCFIEGGIDAEMAVALSVVDVHKWIDARLKDAERERYSALSEKEEVEFYKSIVAGEPAALPLYKDGDESSAHFYALIAKPFTCGV